MVFILEYVREEGGLWVWAKFGLVVASYSSLLSTSYLIFLMAKRMTSTAAIIVVKLNIVAVNIVVVEG